MNSIEAAKDIYSVASGLSDYINIAPRKPESLLEYIEITKAFGDIASGAGTVVRGVGSVVGECCTLVADNYGAEPSHWATGSVTKMNMIGKFMV